MIYGQLIFDKRGRNMQWEKDCSTNDVGKNGDQHAKEWQDHFLTPFTKINSKRTRDSNVRPENINILEKSTGSNFSDICHSNIFLDMFPQAWGEKNKNKLLGWDQN